MGGATINQLTAEADGNSSLTPNSWTTFTCQNLTLPKCSSTTTLTAYIGYKFNNVLQSVTIPSGYTAIGDYAFTQKTNLATINLPSGLISIGQNAFIQTAIANITLPNSLESIGDNAFQQSPNLKAISFPAGFKTLGDNVFGNTKLYDVYFLGKDAPTVGNNAFDAGTYFGNSGFVPTNYSDTNPIGDTNNGIAERRNFINGANTFGVLHLRADLTNEQRAKYTDITRKYEVIKDETNAYRAFKDLYYGDMKIWPGQYSYTHTYNDAVEGVLWDRTTTYDATKYMGLHKFSLTASDVYVYDTENWPFGYKGQQWWTICVPFNMTKAQVRATFGKNTEVCKLNEVVRNKELHNITLKFQDDVYKSATSDNDIVITAHVSYMIFPTVSPTVDIKFNGYQLEEGSPLPTIVTATKEGAITESGNYTYRFIGNYFSKWDVNVNDGVSQPIYMPKYAYFLGNKDGKHVFFYQTGDNGKWNPYTATVQVFNSETSSAQTFAGEDDSFIFTASGAKMASYFGNCMKEYTTSIELPATSMQSMNTAQNVYNLNGQLVRQGNASLKNLPVGVYIVNGKKFVVR